MQLIRRKKFNFYSAKTLQNLIIVNKYALFDDVNDYLNITSEDRDKLYSLINDTVTIEFRMRNAYGTGTDSGAVMGIRGSSSNEFLIWLGNYTSNVSSEWLTVSCSNTSSSSNTSALMCARPSYITHTTWVHIAIVMSPNYWKIYIDGVEATYANQTTFNGLKQGTFKDFGILGATAIGQRSNDTGWYGGGLSDFRIWNTERTLPEINAFRTKSITTPTTGLIMNLLLNGDGNDNSGNSINATPTNGVAFPYKTKTAASFDGVNDYIPIDNVTSLLNTTNSQTIEFWIRPKASSVRVIAGFKNANNIYLLITFADWTSAIQGESISIRSDDIVVGVTSTTVSQMVNVWSHAAIVLKNNEWLFYINGVLQTTGNSNNDLTRGNLSSNVPNLNTGVIGTRLPNFANHFIGDIHDFRIWNTERTQAQIVDNMNITITTPQENLVVNYTLDNTFDDLSGNNFHTVGMNGISFIERD
ncbi:LamG-like jellyroll fold domain-containing protein [Rufibacter sp. LB8]|uniref:LamG domain-containing protein n=1 Tax=Rufibacter sp. LB8 TaxID=2777781 RepID=UPI00178C72D3|nr:LamG-like jellyroll fold domain-containing protein [Rufibacter sp. LB8]